MAHLDETEGKRAACLVAIVHVTLQVYIQEFEDEIQLLVCVYDVEQSVQSARVAEVSPHGKPISAWGQKGWGKFDLEY